MAKQFFRACKFRPEALEQIDRANEVVEEYQAAGLKLTARQLYYQFVSKNWIANTVNSYKNLTGLISNPELMAKRAAQCGAAFTAKMNALDRTQKLREFHKLAADHLRLILKHGLNTDTIANAHTILDTLDALEKK